VKEDPVFIRRDDDLHMERKISIPVACLGGELEIPTLEGKSTVKVPVGTQPNTQLRVREKGLPHGRTGRRGDLIIHMNIAVPTKLSKEQKQLLKNLAESLGDTVEQEGNIFKKVFGS
jgi:molecular chaperone DnaJ